MMLQIWKVTSNGVASNWRRRCVDDMKKLRKGGVTVDFCFCLAVLHMNSSSTPVIAVKNISAVPDVVFKYFSLDSFRTSLMNYLFIA